MARALPPWKLRAADFNSPGWHTRATVGYELMFEFLRLSPSYELARKEAAGQLNKSELGLLPRDFRDVRRTYALLGDVQSVLFRSWWLQRGLHAFGNPHSKPGTHQLQVLRGGEDVLVAEVIQGIEQYLEDTRRDEGLAPALLMAVPLVGRKSDVLQQISKLLDQHAGDVAPASKPILSLHGQRLRAKVLFNGVRLLWIRAARPKWELWRLGAKARLSPTYSSVLDPEAPRKVKEDQEMVDREMMSKITHRALIKFEAIAENAARGRFPSEQPVQQVPFDYPTLARIIQRKNMWESREKARLLKGLEARSARQRSEDVAL